MTGPCGYEIMFLPWYIAQAKLCAFRPISTRELGAVCPLLLAKSQYLRRFSPATAAATIPACQIPLSCDAALIMVRLCSGALHATNEDTRANRMCPDCCNKVCFYTPFAFGYVLKSMTQPRSVSQLIVQNCVEWTNE